MSQTTHFSVARGSVVSDCLAETHRFIEQNLSFFYGSVRPLTDALGDDGDVIFASSEDDWTFACRVERAELGRVATASGVLVEGSGSHFDSILSNLGQSSS